MTPLRSLAWLTSLALFASLAACQPNSKVTMTPEEAQRVKEWTAKMTPRCMGRLVVDLPKAFVLNSQSDTEIDGVSIKIKPQTRMTFDFAFDVMKKAHENKMMVGKSSPPISSLRQIFTLPSGEPGGVFDRAKSAASGRRMTRSLDLMGWRDGYQIEATIEANDPTFPEYANEAWAKRQPNNVQEKLDTLLKVFARVQGRADSEMPTEDGLCIANGLIRGPASGADGMQLAYHLMGARDVYFSFVSRTTLREKTTMLERSAKTEREMKESGTTTVRKGVRSSNGIAYEEWLMRGPTPERVPGQMFILKANETIGSPDKPFMHLTLYNGFDIPARPRTLEESAQMHELTKATLSEAESVALWDAVTATLRPRVARK
jgi:Tle cognate immunity protein 4 C-terminal domain/Tle cognate immunity protein 4 N-terminal domain